MTPRTFYVVSVYVINFQNLKECISEFTPKIKYFDYSEPCHIKWNGESIFYDFCSIKKAHLARFFPTKIYVKSLPSAAISCFSSFCTIHLSSPALLAHSRSWVSKDRSV